MLFLSLKALNRQTINYSYVILSFISILNTKPGTTLTFAFLPHVTCDMWHVTLFDMVFSSFFFSLYGTLYSRVKSQEKHNVILYNYGTFWRFFVTRLTRFNGTPNFSRPLNIITNLLSAFKNNTCYMII